MITVSSPENAGIQPVHPEDVPSFRMVISHRIERLSFCPDSENSNREVFAQHLPEVAEKKTVRAVEPVEVSHLRVSGPSL